MYYEADDVLTFGAEVGREPLPGEFAYPVPADHLRSALEFNSMLLLTYVTSIGRAEFGAAGGDPEDLDAFAAWADSSDGEHVRLLFRDGFIAQSVTEALLRELDSDDGWRVEMHEYPTSGFGFLATHPAFHPGHPDYAPDTEEVDDPMTVEELDEWIAETVRRVADLDDKISGYVDELAALMREPDTPDRQYRMDAVNHRIDMTRRMQTGMRSRVEQLRAQRSDESGSA